MKRKGTDPTYDPGASLCGHENRVHYLGGGLWVCFGCLVKTLKPLLAGRSRS
jgi:hypothetical protein